MPLKFSSKELTFVPTWEGNNELSEDERIEISYKPLKVKDVFFIQNLIGDANRSKIEDEKLNSEDFNSYWEMLSQVITKYTFNWKNVTIDGVPETDPNKIIEVFTTNEMELLNEIFNHVMGNSTVSEEEEKNLETPSEDTA